MAGRIRTLKPEWLENQRLASCSDGARVLSVGLILLADDQGNGRASFGYLAGAVWPESDDARGRVGRALPELQAVGYVEIYQIEGQRYFHVPGWERHQRVDHPGKPRVPGPDDPRAERIAGVSREPRERLLLSSNLAKPHDSRESRESVAPDHDHDHDLDQDHDQGGIGGDLPLAAGQSAAPTGSTSKGRKKPKPAEPTPQELEAVDRVIGKLNERSGREYSPRTPIHRQRIVRLLRAGYSEQDLRIVIWDRANAWEDDPKMAEYIRPSTLFGPDKFPDYVVQARAAYKADAAATGNGSRGAPAKHPQPSEFTRTLAGGGRR